MLRLRLSPSVESFREEFSEWLKGHPPPAGPAEESFEQWTTRARKWQGEHAAGRWLGVHWPAEYGGRGLSLVEEAVAQEELARAGAPQILGLFGLSMVGPVLIRHGTEAQRSRFLPRILNGDEIWCQGFSEPGAGSDLAAIRTRAEAADDGFEITGQKVWTSFAHVADYCFILCRTSEEGAKHRGLTYLLVDMRSPGISVRPLKQISGDSEFNEVFFDKVRVPGDAVVGTVGSGWSIAVATLMYERVVLTFARQLQSEAALKEILSESGAVNGGSTENAARLVAKACAVRALAYSHLLSYADGREPGPEGSMDKLLWSEFFQEISKTALGVEGAACCDERDPRMHRYLYSRGRTIAAGTSEIQRNIIAERVLGLPRH